MAPDRRAKLKIWFGRNGLAWHVLKPALHYFSPSFHPWQHDNRRLIEAWLERNNAAWQSVRRDRP